MAVLKVALLVVKMAAKKVGMMVVVKVVMLVVRMAEMLV